MASIVTGDRSNGFEVLQDRIKLQTGNVLPTNSAPGQLFYKLDEQRVKQIITLVKNQDFGQLFISDTHADRTEKVIKKIHQSYKIFKL